MTTLAQQVRALQTLTAAELAGRYIDLFGKAPRNRNRAFLLRQCAWKTQERALGGLSDRAKARLDELAAQIELPTQPRERARPRSAPAAARVEPAGPMVGTTLVREWRGQRLLVEVREKGFLWNGQVYGSLSATAKAITGAAWNGRLFFGLTARRGR